MASSGPLFPGTLATALETGDDNTWVNPGNAGADDGAEAQVTDATFDANDQTGALRCSNFGFTIPGDATIDGITVEIEQRRFAGAARDHEVILFSAVGTKIGNNKATATAWPGTATVASYGGAADAWGATLTPAIVNASTFGVSVKAFATAANTDVGIDFVRMTVHYTPAEAPGEVSTITQGVGLTSTGLKAGASVSALSAGESLTTPGAKRALGLATVATGIGMTTLGAKVGGQASTVSVAIPLTTSGQKVGQAQPVVDVGVLLTTLGDVGARGEVTVVAIGVALLTIGQKRGGEQAALVHGVQMETLAERSAVAVGAGPLGTYMGDMASGSSVQRGQASRITSGSLKSVID